MNDLVWCDLSTFDLPKAVAFYQRVFGWSPYPVGGGMGDDYTMMYAGSDEAAGLYTMPEFFQKIRMPSFWMSYVQVESLSATIDLAVQLGAKCEVEPMWVDASSQVALIRDPAGAGFTLYQGPRLSGRSQQGGHGRMVWNELHVPSFGEVEQFYSQLFGWQFSADLRLNYRRSASLPSGEVVASVLELDEATKGPKNYWAVWFAVNDLQQTMNQIEASGGSILMRPTEELAFCMAVDDQDAMFCLCDSA